MFWEKGTLENKPNCKGQKELSRGSLDSPLLNNVKHQNRKLSQG